MVYISRIRGNVDRRPKAFWGALIPAALNFVGGLITTSQQAKAQKQAIEEQKKLAQQQLNVSNQNNLSATLNNSIATQDSYDNEDNYNLKYRNGGTRRLGSNRIVITDGGNAKKIGNNTFLLRGGSHEDINETGQTGIGINVGNNEIEAEGGEVAQKKNDSLRIFSAQPMLAGGLSPAQAILKGYNKDKVFAAQERFKRNNHLDDDGGKARHGTAVPYGRIHINEDGTFTDTLTGKTYDTSATNGEDVVITGRAKAKWGTDDFIDAAKTIGSYLPIVGTIEDGYNFYKNPTLENAGWLALGAASDIFGGRAVVKGFKALRNINRMRGVANSIPRLATRYAVQRQLQNGSKQAIRNIAKGTVAADDQVLQDMVNRNRNKKRNGSRAKYYKPNYYHWMHQTSDNLKVSPIDNDYDYRAYYDSATPWELANTMYNAKNGHFTDIGKRPSHPTFSNESKYSNSKTPGGTWNGNVFVPAIWQFGNNGNRIRNRYMNNTGEGYFNGRRNVYPKYGLGGTIKNVWNFLKSNRKPTDNVAALAIAYQLFNPNSNYNKQKGKFNGGNFEGSGAGGTWTKDYKPKKGFDNFNDAYDDAVDHNAETFIFGNKRYNTLKENNPIRELNNRAVGSWRDSVVTKDRNGYGKDFGPIKGAASLFPIVTETYNPKRSRRRCGGRIKAQNGLTASYRTIVDGGIPGTDSYSPSRMRSGYDGSPLNLLNILNYLDRYSGFVDENGNSRYITGIAPAYGTSSTRNFQQLAKAPEASYTLKQTLALPSKEMIRARRDKDIVNNITRNKAANDIARIRNYNTAKMQAANLEANFSPILNQYRYAKGQPILVNTKGYYTTSPRTIERSAKHMTDGANPFLYTGDISTKAAAKNVLNGSKQAYTNVKGKITNPNTYRYSNGAERVRDANGRLVWRNNYKLRPWVKATAAATGAGLLTGIGAGLSNIKTEDKEIQKQLDAYGNPVSPYIARPNTKQTSNKTRKDTTTQIPDSIRRPTAKKDSVVTPAFKQALGRDSVRRDSVKSTRSTVKPQQNKVATPQYKGNVTKGNYQLHDGETKVINGIKYSRIGNNIINHKTNVAYVYDKNGNYTGQADYSKVGKNFNDAFDAARAAGRSNFIYRAGKYNNYSTAKEENAKKEARNRAIGARRIAKRFGGLELPRRRALNGTDVNLNEVDVTARNKRRFNNWDNYMLNNVLNNIATPNVSYQKAANTPKVQSYLDLMSTPYAGRQSSFKPATQDYVGLGIDTLAALGSGILGRRAYNKLNFDYNIPSYVDETPVAFDTTYHNEAQQANVERNRINGRNLIQGNTASAQTALSRMQSNDTNAMMELNKLADEKANKEVELRNQNATNEQQVRARNAAARNQYYQTVAQIKNSAIEAKNNAALAKAQSIGTDLSGLAQAWSNFATSIENRYDSRQNQIAAIARANNPAIAETALSMGYDFSPEALAGLYNTTSDNNIKKLILSRLTNRDRIKYGIQ